MKNNVIVVLVVGCLFMSIGCASGPRTRYQWVHQNKNSTQYTKDYNACNEAVSKNINLRLKSALGWATGNTSAGDKEWRQRINSCLKDKGWHLEKIQE
jgi:hypothetical protein